MKKVILTVVVLVLGFVGFAQEEANTSNESVVLRITESMSNDDIGLEFINNFYKIELSDVTTNKKGNALKNKSKQYKKNRVKDAINKSGYNIILDLAVRTTNDMRPSLNSIEEVTA
jgi:hypothetical protein